MKKIIFLIFVVLVSFLSFIFASQSTSNSDNCIQLNTNIPGIGNKICMGKGGEKDDKNKDDNATYVTPDTAFPKLMGSLTKILVAIIIAVGFLMIIVGGVMIAGSGLDQSRYGRGKEMVIKVIIGIALLGLSGVILHMINPNFFK